MTLYCTTGLSSLNDHLSTRSYVSGYQPSGSDVQLAYQIPAGVDGSKYPHVRRWLTHILSLDGHQQLAAQQKATAAAPKAAQAAAAAPSRGFVLDVSDSDSDFNLSDDDEDDGGAAAILKRKQEEAAAAKKKDKPAARSSVIWDIKPEDDETDMNQVEAGVRAIRMEGLEWQAGERVPVAYGIEKLRIISQIVDDLVPTDGMYE
jgi:elongation factor 1-beta